MTDATVLDELVERLKAEGWREQDDGQIYINGSVGTNLLKGGQVLSLSLELWPDEEVVEDLWPETVKVGEPT